jgi:flagellar hook protein FlgE
VLKQDGLELGSLTSMDFDERGNLKLTYSNGETKTVGSLQLAMFETPDQLQSLGRSLFAATEKASPRLGSGMSSGLGRVVGGQVELSNVELTEQFTDLIIIQRGYQASSQIGSVANEMMQQLLAMDSRR